MTKAHYSTLLELSPDAIVLTDPRGRVIMGNQRAVELWGLEDSQEVAGLGTSSGTAGEGRTPSGTDLRKFVEHQEAVTAEHEIVRPDGTHRTIEASAKPLVDGSGQLSAVLVVARDVTDRKRAEYALRASEAQHAAVATLGWWGLKRTDIQDLMNLALGTVTTTLGVEFAAIHELNAHDGSLTVRAAFGWPDRLVGRQSPHDCELKHRYGVMSTIAAVLQGQQSTYGLISAHSRTEQSYTPDAADFMQSVANVLVTAIERQRAEQALRHREQEFRALVDNAADLILRFGTDLEVLYLNPSAERALGRPVRSLMGRPARDLPMPSPASTTLELGLQQAFDTGRQQVVELLLPSPSGERYYQARLSPEFSDTRVVEHVLAIARDITDMRGSQQERELLRRELIRTQQSLQNVRTRLTERSYQAIDELPDLSRREREILRLVADGLTNQAIGARLSISAGTVKNHLRNVLPKLNAVSRSQAVARAVDLGLLSPLESGPT